MNFFPIFVHETVPVCISNSIAVESMRFRRYRLNSEKNVKLTIFSSRALTAQTFSGHYDFGSMDARDFIEFKNKSTVCLSVLRRTSCEFGTVDLKVGRNLLERFA